MFNAPGMMEALLSGRKTQTRRLVDESKLKVRLPVEVRSDMPIFDRGEPPLVAKPGAPKVFPTAVQAYESIWSHLYGDDSLRSDPWVWAYTFTRLEKAA